MLHPDDFNAPVLNDFLEGDDRLKRWTGKFLLGVAPIVLTAQGGPKKGVAATFAVLTAAAAGPLSTEDREHLILVLREGFQKYDEELTAARNNEDKEDDASTTSAKG